MSSIPSASSSPSICVVGAGRWGANHVKTLAQLGMLGGIVDVDPGRRGQLAGQYPGVQVFASVEEALQHGFAGWVVATPAPTHYEVARRLLDRGQHVLVEKPIALRTDEARDLCRRARERGVNLMVGHVLLFHPAIRVMRELIDSGKIGRLQYIYSNRLNLGTVRTEENILWSFAPHDVSIFQFFVGARPISVESRGAIFLQPGIHDTTMTMLRYPDNVVCHIFLSWLHPYKEHRIVVVGSKGMLSFEDSSESKDVLFYEKGIDWVKGEPVRRDGPTETIPYERKAPLAEELRHFAAHLDGSPVTIATGDNGAEVLEILEQATRDLLASGGPGRTAAPAPPTEYYVHPTALVDDGAVVGAGTKIWHFSHVQPGARIGEKSSLGQNVNVGPRAVVGSHCRIQNNVSIYEGVTLEDYVFCGPSMVFTNVRHTPRAKYPRQGASYDRTLVREGATIGANATIVCGTTIGRHAFVAAGAVVARDVPDHAMVAGVPARRVGWVCECGERLPPPEPTAACPGCGRAYRLSGDALAPVS